MTHKNIYFNIHFFEPPPSLWRPFCFPYQYGFTAPLTSQKSYAFIQRDNCLVLQPWLFQKKNILISGTRRNTFDNFIRFSNVFQWSLQFGFPLQHHQFGTHDLKNNNQFLIFAILQFKQRFGKMNKRSGWSSNVKCLHAFTDCIVLFLIV